MQDDLVNADFAQRAAVRTADLPWAPSPQAGVQRRMLDRISRRRNRARDIACALRARQRVSRTRACAGRRISCSRRIFSDEHGDYAEGVYVRNPPGSRHSPRTEAGCVILVKLRQMQLAEEARIVIDTASAEWSRGDVDGHTRLSLYATPGGEQVTMERLEAGARLAEADCPGGEEIFVLSGSLTDEHGSYPCRTWIRNPPGHHRRLGSVQGSVYWMKRGHLRPVP